MMVEGGCRWGYDPIWIDDNGVDPEIIREMIEKMEK